MPFTSWTGLSHVGNVCEPADESTFEEVYEGDGGATIRRCRVCGARREAFEDDYGRAVPEPHVSG
jgi:hypothetical protein